MEPLCSAAAAAAARLLSAPRLEVPCHPAATKPVERFAPPSAQAASAPTGGLAKTPASVQSVVTRCPARDPLEDYRAPAPAAVSRIAPPTLRLSTAVAQMMSRAPAPPSPLPLPVASSIITPPLTPPSFKPASRRPRKHELSFILDSPPNTDVLRAHSSPVSTTALAPGSPGPVALPTASDAPVACGECGLPHATPAALAAHARLAHPSKPFACRLCGRCFGEKGNMSKHIRTVHCKERRLPCPTCCRRFAFQDGLTRHVNMVHLKLRPFECTICACPGAPHAPYIACMRVCGVRFKQKSHRTRHILSVHRA